MSSWWRTALGGKADDARAVLRRAARPAGFGAATQTNDGGTEADDWDEAAAIGRVGMPPADAGTGPKRRGSRGASAALRDLGAIMPRPMPGAETEHLLRVIAAAGPDVRTIELIAANPGEGTSTTILNLARARCKVTEGAVLLVDLTPATGRGLSHEIRRRRAQTLGVAEAEIVELGTISTLRSGTDFGSGGAMRLRLSRVGTSALFLGERVDFGDGVATEPSKPSLSADSLGAILRDSGLGLARPFPDGIAADPKPPGRAGRPTLFGEIQDLFSSIFIDAPALATSLEGLIVASRVDAVILVLAAEGTRIAVARNLRDRIAEAGGTIIGIILNKRRYYIPKVVYDRL